MNVKGLGSLVTTFLLLAVTVLVALSFQTWYSSFSLNKFTETETKGKMGDLEIIDLQPDELFIRNTGNSNVSYSQLKINSQTCNINGILESGLHPIDLDNCDINLERQSIKLALVTDEGILEKTIYSTLVTQKTYMLSSVQDFLGGSATFDSFSPVRFSSENGGQMSLEYDNVYAYAVDFLKLPSYPHEAKLIGNNLYVLSWKGVSIIDTKGTITPSDDELIANYNGTFFNNTIGLRDLKVDETNNLLYIAGSTTVPSTSNSIFVIDTMGTATQADDALIHIYNSTSSPSILNTYLSQIQVDTSNGLIYFGSYYNSSFYVIDMQGTPKNFADDTISSYSIASVETVYFDADEDALIIGTNGQGVFIIDRNGTPHDVNDDLVNRYYSGSTPNFLSSDPDSLFYLSNDRIYYYDWNREYYEALDTNGTLTDMSDDIIYNSKNTLNSLWAELNTYAWSTFFHYDNVTHYLYFKTTNTDNRIYVIDTNGTATFSDDSLVKTYNPSESPILNLGDSSWNPTEQKLGNDSLIFLSGADKLLVFNASPPSTYNSNGTYVSQFIPINVTKYKTLSWKGENQSGQGISLQTRATNDSLVKYFEDFGATFNLSDVGDLNAWGQSQSNVSLSSGILSLSNCTYTNWCDISIDTKSSSPRGVRVTARVRVLSQNPSSKELWMYQNDWWNSAYNDIVDFSDWTLLSFVSLGSTVETIGFELYAPSNNLAPEDEIQVDWIKIEDFENTNWGAWSTEYTNATGSNITTDLENMTYLQVKVNLYTNDSSQTPTLQSFTLNE